MRFKHGLHGGQDLDVPRNCQQYHFLDASYIRVKIFKPNETLEYFEYDDKLTNKMKSFVGEDEK